LNWYSTTALGRAAGQWTQYAEISVKRVLNRNGDSSYYVNNQHVRRRDLTDIFLGTGLGTKTSYAIIEQGMISRIIEAKPDEVARLSGRGGRYLQIQGTPPRN